MFGNLVLYCFFNCPEMMPSRKDNLYIIRIKGIMSSVKPRWWESSDFSLSSTWYALLRFLLKEVKVPWNICLLKCYTNMLLNADIWWSFSTVKFRKVSLQERTQKSGVGRTRKGQVTELCSRPLRSRRFEIIKKYCSHRKGNGSLLLLRHFSSLYNSN